MDIYVDEIKYEENTLKCHAEADISEMTGASRMIVDSDNMSFIYLLDDGDAFQRLHFVKETWSMLKDYKDSEIVVNGEVGLTDFWEEMDYLLENIVDNNNYGKEFETAVREQFGL
ncbi:hypothetical protein [Salinicoccus sp. HZC-1]|uniref:UPF0738 family protein n=1 Tax=Salinicoccus sp. HZC-1 TaxID=3385497 RepID=UPI00398B2D93